MHCFSFRKHSPFYLVSDVRNPAQTAVTHPSATSVTIYRHVYLHPMYHLTSDYFTNIPHYYTQSHEKINTPDDWQLVWNPLHPVRATSTDVLNGFFPDEWWTACSWMRGIISSVTLVAWKADGSFRPVRLISGAVLTSVWVYMLMSVSFVNACTRNDWWPMHYEINCSGTALMAGPVIKIKEQTAQLGLPGVRLGPRVVQTSCN